MALGDPDDPRDGDRFRVYRRRPKMCPTCKRVAIYLIVPWWCRGGEWGKARCNRCAGDEAFDSEEYKVHLREALEEGT